MLCGNAVAVFSLDLSAAVKGNLQKRVRFSEVFVVDMNYIRPRYLEWSGWREQAVAVAVGGGGGTEARRNGRAL